MGDRWPKDSQKRHRVNFQIRVPQVRLISEEGTQLGIINRDQALRMAQEKMLDLVELVPTANPPICRLMDYKKFLYEQKKKEKELRKKQKLMVQKEIRMTPETSEHDYQFKRQHIEEFLKEGYRVKVTIFYKGREILHKERGYQLLERLLKDLAAVGKVERPARLEGPRLSINLIPV
ncbi:MAG: translation initiation factor IF-3 [Candidatus Omnitrophica bacterium]|nr:translation initiation factor IF-3 [Candidatus Omnitrophota bacterium]